MKSLWLCALTIAAITAAAGPNRRLPVDAANWPQWRGPFGNGVSPATNLPTNWSLQQNIVWKTPLPSWSGGTPVVWGGYVFVTSPSKSGTAAASAPQSPPPPPPGGGPPGGGRGGFGQRGFGRGGYGGNRDPGG